MHSRMLQQLQQGPYLSGTAGPKFPGETAGVREGQVKAAVMLTLFTSMRQSPCKPRAVQWPSNRKKI